MDCNRGRGGGLAEGAGGAEGVGGGGAWRDGDGDLGGRWRFAEGGGTQDPGTHTVPGAPEELRVVG